MSVIVSKKCGGFFFDFYFILKLFKNILNFVTDLEKLNICSFLPKCNVHLEYSVFSFCLFYLNMVHFQ